MFWLLLPTALWSLYLTQVMILPGLMLLCPLRRNTGSLAHVIKFKVCLTFRSSSLYLVLLSRLDSAPCGENLSVNANVMTLGKSHVIKSATSLRATFSSTGSILQRPP